jgi:hypothetical protein
MNPLDIAPLMYGFVRVGMVVGRMDDCERQLRRYARDEGFELATVFHDHGDGGAFEELLCELVRSEARHVIVPTMEHLAGLPVPRHHLLARLKGVGATAWTMPDSCAPVDRPWRRYADDLAGNYGAENYGAGNYVAGNYDANSTDRTHETGGEKSLFSSSRFMGKATQTVGVAQRLHI